MNTLCRGPRTPPGTQIEKVQFPDFGMIDTTEPQPPQSQKASNRGAPRLPLSHSSQVLTSALASQQPTRASAPSASGGAAEGMTITTSAAGNAPAPVQPATGAVAPAPSATAAAPTASKPVATPEPPTGPAPSPTVRFSIRNARQNEPYEAAIQRDPNVPGLRLLDVTLPEGAAVTVDLDHWRITGTPAIAGEFNLGLRYAYADEPAHVSHTTGMPFVINADPKTLWQNNPSDRSAPFWKEDSATSVILGQHAKMIAARKRGRSHAHKGTCCDDDFHLHCDDAHGWYLAVVADGAGSAKFSRRGSQIATRAVGSYLKDVFSDDRGSNLIEAIEALAEGSRPDATNDDLIHLQTKNPERALHDNRVCRAPCRSRASKRSQEPKRRHFVSEGTVDHIAHRSGPKGGREVVLCRLLGWRWSGCSLSTQPFGPSAWIAGLRGVLWANSLPRREPSQSGSPASTLALRTGRGHDSLLADDRRRLRPQIPKRSSHGASARVGSALGRPRGGRSTVLGRGGVRNPPARVARFLGPGRVRRPHDCHHLLKTP